MAQLFPRSATTAFRVGLFSAAVFVFGLFLLGEAPRSAYLSEDRVTRQQPVAFSHRHHVGDAGIDCRYCHTSVEDSAFAGIPATEICMNCHRQLWAYSSMLAAVRESYRSGSPILWTRVYDLPDYVYFDHSIHINKGVGCSTCHGRVDQMALTRLAVPLLMTFCLNCHRHPERFLRPRQEVFNMRWRAPRNQEELGRRLVAEYQLPDVRTLTSCSTCHR